MNSFFTPGWWALFVPSLFFFALAFAPILAADVWGQLFGYTEQIAGFGAGWGLVVAIPASVAGGLALVVGFLILFLKQRAK